MSSILDALMKNSQEEEPRHKKRTSLLTKSTLYRGKIVRVGVGPQWMRQESSFAMGLAIAGFVGLTAALAISTVMARAAGTTANGPSIPASERDLNIEIPGETRRAPGTTAGGKAQRAVDLPESSDKDAAGDTNTDGRAIEGTPVETGSSAPVADGPALTSSPSEASPIAGAARGAPTAAESPQEPSARLDATSIGAALLRRGESKTNPATMDGAAAGDSPAPRGNARRAGSAPARPSRTPEARNSSRDDVPELKLQGIAWDRTAPMAMIDGREYKVGDSIGDAVITEINQREVKVRIGDRVRTLRN